VIDVPTGPELGLASSWVATVNVVVAELSAASVPVNVCVPFEVEGIVNRAQANVPFAAVVVEQTVPPLHDTVTADVAA